MIAMFCPKCGNILEDGAKFCSSCGARVETYNETKVNEPCHNHEEIPYMNTASNGTRSLDVMSALKLVFGRLTDFNGRSRRSEYWWTALVLGLAQGILTSMFESLTNPLQLIGMLLLLAVSVRRLHDVGKSGWWYLFNFLPVIGQIILLIQMVRDSAPDNRYGPNPKTM